MFSPLPHHIKVINDAVMGGQSTSSVHIIEQGILFSGEVSLANNGGFASMRSQWPWLNRQPAVKNHNLIQLRVKGDGKRYQFRLFTADNIDGSAYVYNFATKNNKSVTISIAFSEFSPRFRGRPIQKPPLDLNNILEYGLLIGDKQEGGFAVFLESLSTID